MYFFRNVITANWDVSLRRDYTLLILTLTHLMTSDLRFEHELGVKKGTNYYVGHWTRREYQTISYFSWWWTSFFTVWSTILCQVVRSQKSQLTPVGLRSEDIEMGRTKASLSYSHGEWSEGSRSEIQQADQARFEAVRVRGEAGLLIEDRYSRWW